MTDIVDPSDPNALIRAIIVHELQKIQKQGAFELLLDERQVASLERLARVLRTMEPAATPMEEPTTSTPADLTAALALVT